MMPPRAFIAREEKSLLGFKGQADLLGANDAAGASKLKSLLIYSFGNLRSLKNYAKSTLPLLYKWMLCLAGTKTTLISLDISNRTLR